MYAGTAGGKMPANYFQRGLAILAITKQPANSRSDGSLLTYIRRFAVGNRIPWLLNTAMIRSTLRTAQRNTSEMSIVCLGRARRGVN